MVAFLNLHWQTRSHAERGESFQNQDFLGGMQKRRRFAAAPLGFRKPISKNCGLYCTTFEPTLASIRRRTDFARSACVVALDPAVRPRFRTNATKAPPARRVRRQPRKKNTPCISDFAGGGCSLEKERGGSFGVLPSKYSGRSGAEMRMPCRSRFKIADGTAKLKK